MVRKIAIDWDESELRLVSAQCSGTNMSVTEAALIPIQDGNVLNTLREAIVERGLSGADTLVAIGRGKAELRDLQLPPVPAEDLPDMVRLQAIRSFASAGDSATVDFLVTDKSDSGTSLIAAAVGPAKLSEIHEVCEAGDLEVNRIALRPLAASALYLTKGNVKASAGETVLIDQLSDDAEIVVVRDGKVIFVRTVRMPSVAAARSNALAGELRRSLVACGASSSPDKVIVWGRESVHRDEVEKIQNAIGGSVEVVNPFDLIDVDSSVADKMPEHVGRFTPLVGLLSGDQTAGHLLVDFLNPRQRPEEKPDTLRKALLIGVPALVALLLAFFAYRNLSALDSEIATLADEKKELVEPVELLGEIRVKTNSLDTFLDGDVNWLNELRRMSESMPGSDQLILKSIIGAYNERDSSATLTITGGVTDPSVIQVFEESLSDDFHKVTGDGSSEDGKSGPYRWTLNEVVKILPGYVRTNRYGAVGPRATNTSASEEPDPVSKEEEPDKREETRASVQDSGDANQETQS